MPAEPIIRQLRRLKRMLEQLESEFADGRIDRALLTDIDRMLEDGLADDPYAARLAPYLDRLRENTLSPRPELFADGIRDCRRLKADIEGLMAVVG